MALSDDLRWRIIYKWFDGNSVEETTRDLLVSSRTVYRVRETFRSVGNVGCVEFFPIFDE